jgi:glycosyltransferase involved in cell wall biosynthesis
MHQHALSAADQVLVPDPDAAERLGGYFPDIHFEVSPHEDMNLARIRPALPRLAPDERLRVVVIGAIGKIKGFDVLLACARNAKLRRLPLEFILMGYSINDRRLRQAGVKVTGRYLEENAQDTLKGLSPHMVWLPSVWPETYSYTLSIALKSGLPVLAFDIGAISRRLSGCDPASGHCLFPLDFAKRPDKLNDRFNEIRSCHRTAEPLQKAG